MQATFTCQAQEQTTYSVQDMRSLSASLYPRTFRMASDTQLFDPGLKPFYHGVASGDPLPDGVIIWTRVTPAAAVDSTIQVQWRIALDTGMLQIVQQGTFATDKSRDYTVKVDVVGLQAATTYYYEFQALGAHSLRGRTRTAPAQGETDHLRFGIVSCSNYEAGFFNAYGRLAARADLDAVLHLGDYIYEYASGVYGDTSIQRKHDSLEAYSLARYRARYGLYRLDADLRAVHQQHPFIVIWDDHETANDAWKDGAQNHTEGAEGTWVQRKADAMQAYMEWLPIRETQHGGIYRKLSYGNLMDLVMLDTRLAARDSQILDVNDPNLVAADRTLLGPTQKQWLLTQLSQSQARWKIIGNQIMFAPFHIGWASIASPGDSFEDIEGLFQDIWDGYPAERQQILDYIDSADLHNIVMLSGDFHSSFAYDVPDTPNISGPQDRYKAVDNYDKDTGEGSLLVEFVTPSVSSDNFDEYLGSLSASIVESQMNSPLVIPPFRIPNPHLKYVDLDRHGYTLLHVTQDSVQAEWMYMDHIRQADTSESFGAAQYTRWGEDHLRSAQLQIPDAINPPLLAPSQVRAITPSQISAPNHLLVHHLFPNPATDWVVIQYALQEPTELSIKILDPQGRTLARNTLGKRPTGMYDLRLDVSHLVPGVYFVVFEGKEAFWQEQLLIRAKK